MDAVKSDAPESRSGLDPWARADLPAPPSTRGWKLLGVIGPGTILLGTSIGSGEWLLGPATFVKHGLTLLWITSVAVFLQTVLNTEFMRYTLYTGEPVLTGFMRTKPKSTFWSWFYSVLYFLQNGWPGWAGAAAGAIFFLCTGRMAGDPDRNIVYFISVGTFMTCVAILVFSGKRIERTLEILNWIMVVCILGGLTVLCFIFASPRAWLDMAAGFVGFDLRGGKFSFIPGGVDWFLIGAFAAYSGAGGVSNITLSNWARDKGFGMGGIVGFIPAAVGGQKVKLAHSGSVFPITDENLKGWRSWWRIVAIDQWGVFFLGALLGMGLPAVLYTSVVESGRDIRGLGIAAQLAHDIAARGGAALSFTVALMGVWVLFKTQLDILEGMVRAITDVLWSGSRRLREWRGGDVRFVYYSVLGAVVVWGLIASRLKAIELLQLGANVAGLVFVISSLHILRINTTLLPLELRPPWWRRVALVAMSIFYAFFVWLWLMGGFVPDPKKGFLFKMFS